MYHINPNSIAFCQIVNELIYCKYQAYMKAYTFGIMLDKPLRVKTKF